MRQRDSAGIWRRCEGFFNNYCALHHVPGGARREHAGAFAYACRLLYATGIRPEWQGGLRALITGVTGFAGRTLALHLARLGWTVSGSHRGRRVPPPALREAGVEILVHDLGSAGRISALLEATGPEVVFHLAGETSTNATATAFAAALDDHAVACCNLLDAVRRRGPGVKVLIPGSSAQFGDAYTGSHPVTEQTEYRPRTLYGIAKTAEAWTARHFHEVHGLAVIRTHTFNCIGPGQRPEFVPATFARQIAAMERGDIPRVLQVGNLAARRDVIDIRDVADAYLLAATRGRPGAVYNVCSGLAPTIGELVEGLRASARVDFEVREDPGRLRAVDPAGSCGDAGKLRQETGWQPRLKLAKTLADVLEEWRGGV